MNIFPLSVQDAATASSSNPDESGEYGIPTSPSSPPTPSPTPTASLSALSSLRRFVDCAAIVHHAAADLQTMSYMEDNEAEDLLQIMEAAVRKVQELQEKYSSHLKTINTQR